VSLLGRVVDAGSAHRYELAEVRDGLFISEGDKPAKLTQFWMLLVLSSVVAAGGVVMDSTPAVIGAMIIAPLATPIYGVALATTIGSVKGFRNSLLLMVLGIAVNIAIGVLVSLLAPERIPITANPQITGRTAPELLDLGVAVAVGIAGAFALTRRDVSNIVAGVAIAISLVPVLAVVGITLGNGHFELATGAFLLFLTNVAAILVAGMAVFGAARYQEVAAERAPRGGRRARLLVAAFMVALIIPLGVATLRTYRHHQWTSATHASVDRWVEGTRWKVESVGLEHDEIVITVVGPGNPPSREALAEDVRRSVPENVVVRLIQVYGDDSEL
jgi:uncharacterized hydrophobic protein (TIGR00271 family)